MLTSESKCIIEAIFCLQKMIEGSHFYDEHSDFLFQELAKDGETEDEPDEIEGLKSKNSDEMSNEVKKRKDSKESKYSNYSSNSNSYGSGSGSISEFSIDEIKGIEEELSEAIISNNKKEKNCFSLIQNSNLANNSTLVNSLNYSLKKEENESIIDNNPALSSEFFGIKDKDPELKQEAIKKKTVISDPKTFSSQSSSLSNCYLENFEYEYMESYLNKSQNYNEYVNGVLKSLIKLRKLNFLKEITKRKMTLPDTNKKHTLLLDLDETLIHSQFELGTETEIYKGYENDKGLETKYLSFHDSDINEKVKFKVILRPGVRNFLSKVSEHFQVGIFTASIKDYADEILNYLDPTNEIFSFKCYRESCIKVGRAYIKDLRIFENRKLQNIVILDNSLYSFSNQLSNGILIDSFYNEENDNELNNILQYLIDYIGKCNDVAFVNDQVFKFQEIFDNMKDFQNNEN